MALGMCSSFWDSKRLTMGAASKTRTRMLSQRRWPRRGQSLFVLTQAAMDGKSTRRESSRRSAVAPPPIWTIACSLSVNNVGEGIKIWLDFFGKFTCRLA